MNSLSEPHSIIVDQQWQVDWAVATALMFGAVERTNGSFMRQYQKITPLAEDTVDIFIFLQDPLPNATINTYFIKRACSSQEKLTAFINGDHDAFFG